MYVVKRLGRNGMWNAVSLIDENGSFRGEAKFETREEADNYLVTYMKRMRDRIKAGQDGEPQVKVFDDSAQTGMPEIPKRELPDKPRKVKASKKRKKKKK